MDDLTFSGFTPCTAAGEAGFYFDFLGTKTRLRYLPPDCEILSGHVFGFPNPSKGFLYEFAEWQGVMAAVKMAKDSFVCIELGAGWGPWLVSTAFAVRHLGISNIRLIGVDAEAQNIENIKTHFSDNGLDYTQHNLFHAAIDGCDAMPSPSNPGGAPLMSLKTLLAPLPIVDLIHCDIQFAEARAFAAGIKEVTDRVRRVVIGTHSRKIEDELIETFQHWSWFLEHEKACQYRIDNDGKPYLYIDGVQVWRNTRLLLT